MVVCKIPKCVVGLLLVASGCSVTRPDLPELNGSKSAIIRNGNVVGLIENEERQTESGYQTTNRQTVWMKWGDEEGRSVIEEETRTTNDSGIIEIKHRSIVGRYEVVTTAQIVDSKAIIERSSRTDNREKVVDLPPEVRFDEGAALLENWDYEAVPQLEFYVLDLLTPIIERVVYTVSTSIEEESGFERTIHKQTYVGENLRSISQYRLDAEGQIESSWQPMFGQDIEAGATNTGANVPRGSANFVSYSMQKSPYRISSEALQGHLRFTFSTEFSGLFQLPETGEQSVTPIQDGFVIDICNTCGPGLDNSEASLKSALEPTFWLQSDHPLITRIANTVRDRDESDMEKMRRLKFIARARMDSIDFAGHFSAADALSRRSGDCTEDAVVLAALGRAAGIPTKIASGIVYSRERYHGVSDAFIPHVWTLAYVDGAWKSIDLSLEDFDSTHIAFTVSDGDPGSIQAGHQLASLMEWDAMTEVRQR